MKKYLIVVDMQNDFVSGSLGTAEALAILPAVERKIRQFDGEIIATLDTHFDSYLETAEGKHLPVVHCVKKYRWAQNRSVGSGGTRGKRIYGG